MSRDDATRLTAHLIVQPRGGGDPVGSRDVDLPPDVEMETLESFVGQRFGEPLDVALVEHPTLGVVRVGWVLEVPAGLEVPGRHEDFELVLIPMIAEPDDPRSLVSVFLRLAESQADFERLAAEGTVDRLVVRDMVPREYRPQPGAVSGTGDPDIGGVLAGIAHDLGGSVRAYPRPGRAVRRVVLRDIRDEDGTRYLDAAIESDGTLRVTGQDEGPGVAQVFGPAITSYEWVYVVAPDRVAALVDELGGTVGDDVLTLLQARHDQGSEGLDALLRSPRIDAQFDSWHGSAGPVEPADQAGREPGEAGSARAEEQTRVAAVQAEHGAAATGRAAWSATTEGEEEEPVTDELPPELLTLLQLDAQGRGDVSPELAAQVCGWDRDLVLRLIRDSEEQVIEWGDSVTEASEKNDPDEARVCEGERRSWQKTVDLLRDALRVIVTRGNAGRRTSPAIDFASDYDGDYHMLALDPSEQPEDWTVLVVGPDDQREEVSAEGPGWFGYRGEAAKWWFVEFGSFGHTAHVEIQLPDGRVEIIHNGRLSAQLGNPAGPCPVCSRRGNATGRPEPAQPHRAPPAPQRGAGTPDPPPTTS